MTKMTKHPLRITADALKNAFVRSGFTLLDNGEYPELETSDLNLRIFDNPGRITKQVLLQNGESALRTQLLPYALSEIRGEFPVCAAACGKVFDGNNTEYPARLVMEGAVVSDMNLYDYRQMWKKIVRTAFGAGYDCELIRTGEGKTGSDLASWGASAMTRTVLKETVTYEIRVIRADRTDFTAGYTGTMTWIGAAMLGHQTEQEKCLAFSIDIDHAACEWLGIETREQLFDNAQEFLGRFGDETVSVSESFEDRCRDVLRTMGYSEGFGPKIYPDGIYKKMNMIQDEWDLNNKGVLLKEPLGTSVGLPTVLTPAIEQIISEKWNAGEKEARSFEVSHIFMPQKDAAPVEKLALSFAAYGDDVTLASFIAEVDSFLTQIGNRNHFFIPNTQAIAYKYGECRLILDEKMSYLGGNFGGMSEKAEENFGIGTHAYMANLELMPLENKAKEEYGYIPPELR
ncbi:MAG: hypothetical protein IJ130_03785 [Solobacterium sp.]|nr:hypothetical protein [Solobacterium sp.]